MIPGRTTTADRRKFVKRIVKTGLLDRGFAGILEGLKRGEPAAADGSLFSAKQYSVAG